MMCPKASRGRHLFLRGRWLIAVFAAVLVAACDIASVLAPTHYTFSQRDVQKAVARQFPYRKTLVQMFEVVLTNPVVELQPAVNRIAVRADAQLVSPLMKQPLREFSKSLASSLMTRLAFQ